MKLNKKLVLVVSILFGVIALALASSYAIFTFNVTKNSNFKVAVGTLELSITDTSTEDKFIMESTVPTKDSVALTQDGYTFTITNTGTVDSYYTVYLDDILLTDAGERLDNSYVKLDFLNNKTNKSVTNNLTDYDNSNRVLTAGYLDEGESISYTLRMWVDYNVGNEAQNKYFATQIRVEATQSNAIVYSEYLLNGADPVLTDNLVPVEIADDGTVTKANLYDEWYSYEDKIWANAVVLKDDSVSYKIYDKIPEANIESYFVWIPKYSYKLWDLGEYNGYGTLDTSKIHAINIEFGLTNTSDSVEGQCTTPMSEDGTQGLSGESGNCDVGEYMTHPAFLAFDTNGLWIGKFATGYDGATTSDEAAISSVDIDKVVIKPNVYSWRNNPIGNAFKVSYEYLRDDDSHMIKNTEWGVISYLTHSNYGIKSLLSANGLSDFLTGYNSDNISNTMGFSTTGNISGIFDMGGFVHITMAYNMNMTKISASKQSVIDFFTIETVYPDFYTNFIYNKYYDAYYVTNRDNDVANNVYFTHFDKRILGDAIGETGPFEKLYAEYSYPYSSWYKQQTYFVSQIDPYFVRKQIFGSSTILWGGAGIEDNTFRIVLAPTK